MRVCDIIALDKSMGKVYLNPIDKKSIERRDKMSNEVISKAVDHMGELQKVSLKSLDMINKNAEGINKLAEFLKEMQDNQNLLATKVMKLERRIDELETKEYERDLNERPKN